MKLPNNVLHLLVGLNADQYASEMRAQLAEVYDDVTDRGNRLVVPGRAA